MGSTYSRKIPWFPISPHSAQGSDRLWNRIYEQETSSAFSINQGFLPEGLLDDLITEESVRTVLAIRLRRKKLIPYVTLRAKKIFATWLATNVSGNPSRLRKIMAMFEKKGIRDEHLPLEASHPIFLTPSQGDQFCRNQWQFLAPVISTEKKNGIQNSNTEEYNMPKSTMLPFTSKDTVAEGAFGQVSKCEIHPNHFKDAGNLVSNEEQKFSSFF